MPERSTQAIYGDYAAEQVTREEQRKASLVAGGLAVVTTAGALATLLLGLATLSKKAHTSTGTFVLPDAARGSLKVALIFFAAAAIAALLTNFPVRLRYVDPADLKDLIGDSSKDVATAEEDVGVTRTVILEDLQKWNDRKGWALFVACVLEVVAIVFVVIAVWRAF